MEQTREGSYSDTVIEEYERADHDFFHILVTRVSWEHATSYGYGFVVTSTGSRSDSLAAQLDRTNVNLPYRH